MREYINDHVDIFKVMVINILGMSFTFVNVESILKILVLSATLFYTLWKWSYDYKKNKHGNKRTGKASN